MKYTITVLICLLSLCSISFSGLDVTAVHAAIGKTTGLSGTLKPMWNETWGGPAEDYANAVAVDGAGVYIAGSWYLSTGAFVVKYDLDGNRMWARIWNGTKSAIAQSIAVDASGIYIAGKTGNSSSGWRDAFVLKYDFAGKEIWNRTWGGAIEDYAASIAIFNSTIYVCGNTNSTASKDYKSFILSYSPGGSLLWSNTYDGIDSESIAADSSGIYVAGGKNYDACIFRTNLTGTYQWNRTWSHGIYTYNKCHAIAVNETGIYATGVTSGYTGPSDVFIFKYDFGGTQNWNKTINVIDDDVACSIAADSSNIYIVGFAGPYGSSTYSAFVLKYDAGGGEVWSRTWKGDVNAYAHGIAMDGSCIFLAGMLTPPGGTYYDAFVLKTNLDGGNAVVPDVPVYLFTAISTIAVFVVLRFRKGRHFNPSLTLK
jgi:hypothetical protein